MPVTETAHAIIALADLPPEVDGRWYLWLQDAAAAPQMVRRLDDRRYVSVMPLIYTQAVIWGYVDDSWGYEDRWCYHDAETALAAATAWNGEGEPEDWHRHPRTGRRRINGDPEQEYVNP